MAMTVNPEPSDSKTLTRDELKEKFVNGSILTEDEFNALIDNLALRSEASGGKMRIGCVTEFMSDAEGNPLYSNVHAETSDGATTDNLCILQLQSIINYSNVFQIIGTISGAYISSIIPHYSWNYINLTGRQFESTEELYNAMFSELSELRDDDDYWVWQRGEYGLVQTDEATYFITVNDYMALFDDGHALQFDFTTSNILEEAADSMADNSNSGLIELLP